MEMKDIEVYGDEAFFNTHNYFCGIDITNKDNAHLLFDVQINNEIILKNEKNEQEKEENIQANQEENKYSNNQTDDYKYLRKESYSNENEFSSSNNYEKHFSFSKNKNKNTHKFQNRKRTGSAIEIDDESSSYAFNYKNNNYNNSRRNYSSDQESNLRTEKKEKNFFSLNNNEKLIQIVQNNDESSYKENESESVFNNKIISKINEEEDSEYNDNNSYNGLRSNNKNILNENEDEQINFAFNKNLNLNAKNEKIYESFFDNNNDIENVLNSEFFMEFVDVNLISTFRDIHDIAGLLYVKKNSNYKEFLDFQNQNDFDFHDNAKSNEIYEKLFLKKGSKSKNKNKYYINFTIDQFAGITCNVNKIINTNNFSVLDKQSENFKKINKLFIDFNNNTKKKNEQNNPEIPAAQPDELDKDPLTNLYNLYKKFYVSNFFDKKSPKVIKKNNHQSEEISKSNENNYLNDLIKYETKDLNKLKTKDLNNLTSNKPNESFKSVSNQKNQNKDVAMKSDEESISDISDNSFNDLVNLREKANNSSDDAEEFGAENNEESEVVDFGKARVNGKLLKMYDLQNKRALLENILLKKNKNENDDSNKNSASKNFNNYNNNINYNTNQKNDLISELSSIEIFSNKNSLHAKNELKNSYSSDNFLNFHNKFNLNSLNTNVNSSINTPKSAVSSVFGFDRKNSENTASKQINSKAASNKNCSFNLNLNLNYSEKKMNKKKSENNPNINNNQNYLNERNIYDHIKEDDEYEMDDIYNGDLERNISENSLGHNQGFSAYNHNVNGNFNPGGSQSDILNMLFDKLKNEK